MSDAEDDSSETQSQVLYNFDSRPLIDDISQQRSIEYLKNYVIQVELDVIRYAKFELKYVRDIDESNYDTIMNFLLFKQDYSYQFELYDIIYNDMIFGFKSHLDEEMLLCGLRLLFAYPTYFNKINRVKRNTLINILIELVLTKEEPISTRAIKCLQVATYTLKKTKLIIKQFEHLANILIQRISEMLVNDTPNVLFSVLNINQKKDKVEIQFLDRSLERLINKSIFGLEIKYFNITTFLDAGADINRYSQIFHHMALLKYIIVHLEIPENDLFFCILYSCINVTACKMGNLTVLALTIIYDLIGNNIFLIRFLETNGLSRICFVPHCLVSSSYTISILFKISKIPSIMQYLVNNNLNEFESVITYCINFHRRSDATKSCNFIINLFNYPELYDIFLRIKGMELIFEKIKKESVFDNLKKINYSFSDININYNWIKNYIKGFIKILLTHVFIQISTLIPFNFINDVPGFRLNKINYGVYNILFEHFENTGGITHKIELLEELFKIDKFEVIVSILRMTCQYYINYLNMEIYKDIMYLLGFFSFYPGSKSLFIHNFDPYPKQLLKGNNIVGFFQSLMKKHYDLNSNHHLTFMPFNIYHNLIASCFLDFKTYKKVINMEYHLNTDGYPKNIFESNKDSDLLMDTMITNDFIYHTLKFLPDPKLSLPNKIYAIKCLLMLLTKKHAIEIALVLQQNFIFEFSKSLLIIWNSENSDNKIRSFSIYSLSLIYLLKRQSYFQPIDISAYPVNFVLKHGEVEKPRRFQSLFLKGDNQKKFGNFDVFKDCITSIKEEDLSNQRLNLYMNLISDIFPTKFPTLHHVKSLTKILSPIKEVAENDLQCNKKYLPHKMELTSYKSIFNKLNKKSDYIKCSETTKIFDAKHLIDDNLVMADNDGIFHVSHKKKRKYIPSLGKIYCIDDSDNGKFIIGGGISHSYEFRFTNIWKYNPYGSQNSAESPNFYKGLNYSKITHDNFNVFGINRDFSIHMIDIETSRTVTKFYNENMTSLPRINCSVIDDRDNLLLSNGDLFCTRSCKLIHSFQKFDPHLSGNFVHSDTKILINCELWDLKTHKLYDRISSLENFIMKKTYNEDILMGIKSLLYQINSLEDHYFYWQYHWRIFEKTIALFDARTFSQIKLIDYNHNIMFANISRDSTKIIAGLKSNRTDRFCNYFQITEIGNKAMKQIDL